MKERCLHPKAPPTCSGNPAACHPLLSRRSAHLPLSLPQFACSPPSLTRPVSQQRQQEYAAELREQIAAKEAARQQERAHSLRQSAALLELRQAAPSAVLPVVGSGLGISRGATTSTGPHSAPWPALHQQHEANPWGPLAHGGSDKGWPPLPGSLGQQQQQAQQHAPQGWAVHDLHPAPSAPPLPLHAEAGWVEPSGRPGHAGPWAQPQSELSYAAGAPIRHSSMLQPPFGVESSGVAAGAQLPLPAPAWNPAVAQAPFGNDLQPPGQPRTRSRSLSNARDGGLASMGSSLPSPWAEAGGGGASSSNGGSMRGWATAGLGQPGSGGPDDKEAARQAAERKRSVYKAELERQMREKEERRRQVTQPGVVCLPRCFVKKGRTGPPVLQCPNQQKGS